MCYTLLCVKRSDPVIWAQVCATCFDLSVSLLRVLEMTVTLVPEIFLDWTRPSAELLLRRLAQVRPAPENCRSEPFEGRLGQIV